MNDQALRVSLTRLHLHDFKAFQDAEVALAPITVIAGVNSSGKSSILQSLLLARNTLATSNINLKESPLVYSEKPLKFIEFEEMVFGYSSNVKNGDSDNWHEMTLGFAQQIPMLAETTQNKYFAPSGGVFSTMDISVDVRFGRLGRQPVVIRSVLLKAVLRGSANPDVSLSLLFEPTGNELWKVSYQDQRQELSTEQRVKFDHFIPILEGAGKPPRKDAKVKSTIYSVYKDLFSPALSKLRDQLTLQLHYVGPLRSAPEPSVIQQQLQGLDVGEAGEKTIQLLHDRMEESKTVNFVRVPTLLEQFNLDDLSPAKLNLKTALYDALRLMGIEQRLKIEKHGVAYQASFSMHQEEQYVPITDVGFGISQVLPIAAVCLLAEPGDLLVFEQPEIHLHPRAQAGLADLLLCTALSGKQVIIETHSDHLINRLRRRLAEDQSNRLANKVQIVFVSPPVTAGQGAVIEQAHINSNGDIENWPEGFLAESPSEAGAILRASLQKISDQPEIDVPEE